MRDMFANFFSYLFMSTIVLAMLAAFGAIIVLIRSLLATISPREVNLGFLFLYIFFACVILAPTFFYIANRLEKHSGRIDEV